MDAVIVLAGQRSSMVSRTRRRIGDLRAELPTLFITKEVTLERTSPWPTPCPYLTSVRCSDPSEVIVLRGQGHSAAGHDVTAVNSCSSERDPQRSTLRHLSTLRCCPGSLGEGEEALTSVQLNASTGRKPRDALFD
ncbi:hypothetical protein RRG08_028853 [Elysia crispata]|uniref:Uncharacterized protein n=1 Tax=Elysia crispata TaxID=231223 RepID=A0AAE0Z0I0_9GAST|nr:hypothetical protein RRG08_028853 [Elysia crispata]